MNHAVYASIMVAKSSNRRWPSLQRSAPSELPAEQQDHKPHKARQLTVEQILVWADAFHARYGRWPSAGSGPIEDSPGETWSAVNAALQTTATPTWSWSIRP
jgi:hypothetical protein